MYICTHFITPRNSNIKQQFENVKTTCRSEFLSTYFIIFYKQIKYNIPFVSNKNASFVLTLVLYFPLLSDKSSRIFSQLTSQYKINILSKFQTCVCCQTESSYTSRGHLPFTCTYRHKLI